MPCVRSVSCALAAFLGLLVPVAGLAQSEQGTVIEGTVVDDSTGQPLPATHVFISGSMTGTTVDDSGHFRLAGLPTGAKRLYVSRVGYKPEQFDFFLRRDTTLRLAFRLESTVVEGKEVRVTAERSEEWFERLARFKRLFVGESEQARRCYLLNPKVLYFDTAWWGKFEADARRPLEFENWALGYRVTYYLKEFQVRGNIVRWDGEPVFDPLSPRDSAEARRWRKNRRRAFRGSLRHFLLALKTDRLEEENFQIYRVPRSRAFRDMSRADRIPTSRERILKMQSESVYELDFTGALEVVYTGEPESEAYLEWANANRSPRDHQVSQIRLNKHPVHFDRHGEIVEPYGATLYRHFAFTQRIADLLPREYRPQGSQIASSTSTP